MPYLKLKKSCMEEENSLRREFLETGISGTVCNSSVHGLHTRKYHGLFIYESDGEFHSLLSNLDVIVDNGKDVYELGGYYYPGNGTPGSAGLNKKFGIEPVPRIESECGEVKVIREYVMDSRARRLHIRIGVEGKSGKSVKMVLRPYLTFRNLHHLKRANMECSNKYRRIDKGVAIQMYGNYPELLMQLSKKSDYYHAPDWYYNAEYPLEKERGYDYSEDLYVPGWFELKIKPGESVIFSAGIDELAAGGLGRRFNKELEARKSPVNFNESLDRAASQFFINGDDSCRVRAGFPWFGVWGRDTFIALPGLTISRGRPEYFVSVTDTMLGMMENGLFPNMEGANFHSVDAPLWFCWSQQQYYYYLKRENRDAAAFRKKYFPALKQVLNSFREGTTYNIRMEDTGLISQGADGKALTWMDAIVEGQPVTPRTGMAVEINALWYNAVCFALEFAEEESMNEFSEEWSVIRDKISDYFVQMFWDSEKGYLADSVNRGVRNWELRPNQVIAVSMPYSPLDNDIKRSVLNYIRNFLLTPKGLRTLAAGEDSYGGIYSGDQKQRDSVYHQGTVWPWLVSHYCEGLLVCYGKDAVKEVEKIYQGFEEDMWIEGIGTVSEIYDGNLPNRPGGSVSQAWSVSELLRIREMLKTEGKLI